MTDQLAHVPAEAPPPERTDRTPGAGRRLADGIGLIFVAVGAVVGGATLQDNSFLTHLATGRHILDTGGVPSGDIYSATAPGEPWVVQSWLASVLYALLERTTDLVGIRLLHAVLVAATIAVIWWLLDRATSIAVRIAAMGIVLGVGATMWQGRPLLFGLLGFVLALAVNDRRLDPRWLVPILWVWGQTHGSFPLAGVMATAALGGAWLDRRSAPGDPVAEADLLTAWRTMVWTVVGTAAVVAGPLGLRGLFFPVELLTRGDALEGVSEWKPPAFDHPRDLVFAVAFVTFVVALRGGLSWRRALPALVIGLTGFLAVRNLALATIVLTVAVSARPWRLGSLTGHERTPLASGLFGLGAAAVALGLLSVPLSSSIDLEGYPTDELTWLDDRGLLDDDGVVIVHRATTGNLWSLRDGADARNFVDDRFDMYPLDILADHRELLLGGDVGEILTRRGADVVLWGPGTSVSSWLEISPEWTIVTTDDDFLIACHERVITRCGA